MHPAYSIIFFTTASGLGYGLLAMLGLYAAFGPAPESRWFGGVGFGIALGLITVGLLSSTFHLGHPERAWRAVTQWRSSWLSREGVMAILTYAPAVVLAFGWVFEGSSGGLYALCGLLVAAGAAITVYCTAMIYASLKAVPRWRNGWTPPVYLLLAAMTGALWFDALLRVFGAARIDATAIAVFAIALAWTAKRAYWISVDRADPVATAGSATGLGPPGAVRLLDSPHTSANYLLQEMGYSVARKHARKLRRVTIGFAFGLPFALALAGLFLAPAPAAIVSVLAALSSAVGVAVERWLFFAEARHVVTLYYGESAV